MKQACCASSGQVDNKKNSAASLLHAGLVAIAENSMQGSCQYVRRVLEGSETYLAFKSAEVFLLSAPGPPCRFPIGKHPACNAMLSVRPNNLISLPAAWITEQHPSMTTPANEDRNNSPTASNLAAKSSGSV